MCVNLQSFFFLSERDANDHDEGKTRYRFQYIRTINGAYEKYSLIAGFRGGRGGRGGRRPFRQGKSKGFQAGKHMTVQFGDLPVQTSLIKISTK